MNKFKRNLFIGFGLSLLILIISSVASYVSIRNLIESNQLVNNTKLVITQMDHYISLLKDAETGQRGYLLTGDPEFLEPYKQAQQALGHALDRVKTITLDDPIQQTYLARLDSLNALRVVQLRRLIVLKNEHKPITIEQLRLGKQFMDEIRGIVNTIKNRSELALTQRIASLETSSRYTPVLIIVAALFAIIITLIFYIRVRNDFDQRYHLQKELQRKDVIINRRIHIIEDIADKISSGNYDIRVTEENKGMLGSLSDSLNKMAESLQYSFQMLSDKEWLKKGVAELNEKIMGETDIKKLTESTIEFIAGYTESQVGTLYIFENKSLLKLYSSYALADSSSRSYFKPGEGLVGQCAVSGKRIMISGMDTGNVSISYAAGESIPKNIVVFPFFHDKEIRGVIELGSVNNYSANHLAFIDNVSNHIGIIINSAMTRYKLQELLEEMRTQAEELHAQHTELQSLNMELESQTEKLQSSDEELRVQQEELMVANQELEERTKLLEEKNQLILERNIEIQTKAEQLELSTKYKSEFLANMSHELRTPLNSILLLSGLMANNEKKDVSDEHVEYARVIQSSGNGLLKLIDEILDLSKIESGKMDIYYEEISLPAFIATLKGLFNPLAKEKNIELIIDAEPGVPDTIQSDKMKLEQVIRNLIANALKFTASGGKVTVHIFKPSTNIKTIAFSVRDNGIGIAKEKQQIIFEAFQQEDGSTRRKFGGTGLGLSISRELARLLKGEIRLYSEEGKGSEFVLYIPIENPEPAISERHQPAVISNQRPEIIQKNETEKTHFLPWQENISDDRINLALRDKVILIIEDDQEFAMVLLGFTRKNGFKGIVAVRGDEGFELAKKYKPIGIMLDVNLPVINGWEVMEKLKSDPVTKNIPVHMMSSHVLQKEQVLNDSVEFSNKPVEFEKIREIFQKFDQAPSQHPKKVLIIEENVMHSKALGYFLENFELCTEITNNVADCIKELQKKDVDCVILNMDISDHSNYARLAEIKNTPGLGHIPVIVFTTKNLLKPEELRLKQYADSIVVKTAHSYQRILDEITLFLHVVDEKNRPEKKAGQYKKSGALKEVLENRSVLITDDDVRNIFSLTKALEAFNMNVISAMDGKEALQQLQENPSVDIVLMDMMMPEMDGYETITHIRKNAAWKNIPIIAVTAKAMAGDREKCIVAGASDYISKPVDIDQLLSLLRVWLYDRQFNKN